MARFFASRTAVIAAAFALSACSTVKMPNVDFLKLPEFKEAAAKLSKGFPSVGNAPSRPNDIRSASDWDRAARAIMAERDAMDVPEDGMPAMSDAQVEQDVEALKAQVRRYKLDDPIE